MDAVSHLVEDDQLEDEPESGDPAAVDEWDWRYLEHVYTNDLPATRELLAHLTQYVKAADANTCRTVMPMWWIMIFPESFMQ